MNIGKRLERTCKCIKDYEIENLIFHKDREYQVDIFPLYYQVYQNGGWEDYIFMHDGYDEMPDYIQAVRNSIVCCAGSDFPG